MIVATLPDPTVLPPSRLEANWYTVIFVSFDSVLSQFSSLFYRIFVLSDFFRTKIEPQTLFNHFEKDYSALNYKQFK